MRRENQLAASAAGYRLEDFSQKKFEYTRIEFVYKHATVLITIGKNEQRENGNKLFNAVRFIAQGNLYSIP